MKYTIAEFEQARHNLSDFVCRKARQMEKRYGVLYATSPDAPTNLQEMQMAYRKCLIDKRVPFPIWDGASDKTMYMTAADNYAFRFWHDILHLALYAETILADELELGHIHVGCVMAEFGMYSLEAAMMRADTIGQSEYAAKNNGNFPDDQLTFVKEYVHAL